MHSDEVSHVDATQAVVPGVSGGIFVRINETDLRCMIPGVEKVVGPIGDQQDAALRVPDGSLGLNVTA